ncbi:hypothetical protein HQ45_05405 [Porphyromonas crevioricanis]|nr:hypothetical protein HQ45_05405 [Porphyromonas crevioricanis]
MPEIMHEYDVIQQYLLRLYDALRHDGSKEPRARVFWLTCSSMAVRKPLSLASKVDTFCKIQIVIKTGKREEKTDCIHG